MSDEHDEPDERPVSAAEQRRVAEVLASVPAEPMPADVADRLHAAIAAEARARSAGPPPRPEAETVVPLASRRRRRVAPVLAAAAVAVGVVAIGGTVITDQVGGGGAESGAGGGSAADTSRSEGRDDDAPGSLAQPPAPQDEGGAAGPSARQDLPRIDDLTTLPAGLRPSTTSGAADYSCRADALEVAAGLTRQVLLRGRPAWLVVVDEGGARRLEAYRCDGVPDGGTAVRIASAPLG